MSSKKPKQYRFIDLFAGIGGFHLGLEQTGRAHCVFSSEWDEPARRTYEHIFKKSCPVIFKTNKRGEQKHFATDITKISPKSIPKFEILCGGFPCQPFSQAGHKKGFSDTRGTLFFRVEEIIRVKKPKAFFLENVRGLITHGGAPGGMPYVGRTMEIIWNRLFKPEEEGGLGYYAPPQIPGRSEPPGVYLVKASDYGVPQHRPRVFIIGFKTKSAAARFIVPKPQALDEMALSRIMGGRVTFDSAGKKLRKIGFTLRCGGKGSRITDRRNWEYYYVQTEDERRPKPVRINEQQGLRLNGFPESYQFPSSVTPAVSMKQLGNSVAVPAVQTWAQAIIKSLDG